MASGGHHLQQQADLLIGRIKTLVNDDLKRICKAHGYQVSGTKQILVGRCVEAVNEAVASGNLKEFEEIRYRVGHRGRSPPPDVLNAALAYPPAGYQNFNMSPQRGGRGVPPPGRPSGVKYFKPSPFYEILETLVPLQDLPEMPQNRHAVRSYLTLKPEVAQQCRNDPNLKIVMYCGLAHSMGPYSLVDVAFPNQIEVKVGEQEVKSNFKGLKKKAGSTKPADITSYVRKFQGQQNVIQVTYALTTNRYAYTIYLVKYHNADTLVDRVKKHNVIREQAVLKKMQEANADPDIAATSIRMSLKDPVSTMRITLPVRSSHCTHNQCFDATFFLQLQEQAPQWSCPVCSKTIPFDSLCVDEYFQKILDATSKSTEKVDIEPDGQWRVIKDDNDDDGTGPVNKPRASYDDDFDDDEDLVEVQQPASKQTNGIKRSQSQASLTRPAALDTPPLSSREASVSQSAQSAQSAQRSNKRPASAVIDLTLSDDEDEQPPRSAKRQQTNRQSSGGTHTNSYNTPTSIPDPPRMQLPQRQSGNGQLNHQQADNHRPNNSSGGFGNSQASVFNTYRQPSASPANTSSPNLTYGQPGQPAQHSRPTPSPLPMPQPYTTSNHSNRHPTYRGTEHNNNPFSPSASAFDNPIQQAYAYQQHLQKQQDGSMRSPAPHPPTPNNTNPAGSSAGGALRLPPMHPPQAQQYPAFPSPTTGYSNPGGSGSGGGSGGGWRSDGSEYGYNFYTGSPSG